MMEYQENQSSTPTCDGLLIYCSDFRFWQVAFKYMIENLGILKFDILCYPGSALNLNKDLSKTSEFLDKIRFLKNRHKFHIIVIANHTDCGGYGDRTNFPSPEFEKQIHVMDLLSAKTKLISEFPGLKIIPIYISQKEASIQVEKIL